MGTEEARRLRATDQEHALRVHGRIAAQVQLQASSATGDRLNTQTSNENSLLIRTAGVAGAV